MENIYKYLHVLRQEDLENINDLLYIKTNEKFAGIVRETRNDVETLFMSGMKTLNVETNILDERSKGIKLNKDIIISKSIMQCGLNPDKDMISVMVFINCRDAVIKSMTKPPSPKLDNKPYMNIEYYGYFIGSHNLDKYADNYILSRLKVFKLLRHERVKEYHRLMNILKYDHGEAWVYQKDRMDYNAEMGLNYIFNRDKAIVFNSDPIMFRDIVLSPLAEINFDYARRKLHIVNVELAYINRNLKFLKAEVRRRKKLPGGMTMISNTTHEEDKKKFGPHFGFPYVVEDKHENI